MPALELTGRIAFTPLPSSTPLTSCPLLFDVREGHHEELHTVHGASTSRECGHYHRSCCERERTQTGYKVMPNVFFVVVPVLALRLPVARGLC